MFAQQARFFSALSYAATISSAPALQPTTWPATHRLTKARPFGVKLHAELAQLLGWALHVVLDASAYIASAFWSAGSGAAVLTLAAVAGVLGEQRHKWLAMQHSSAGLLA